MADLMHQIPAKQHVQNSGFWEKHTAGHYVRKQSLLTLILCISVLTLLTVIDRTNLLDQQNYIQYFRFSHPDYWNGLFRDNNTIGMLASLFTEEFVWRLYTWGLSIFFTPETSVVLTTLLVSSLVFRAFLNVDKPLLGFALWMLLPLALATMGLFQIRQGLAFAVFSYGVIRNKTVLSAILSAGIHATFSLVLIAVIAFWTFSLFSRARIAAMVLGTTLALCLAIIGESLFLNFGGRRVQYYDVQSGATSLNFVISFTILFVFYCLHFSKSFKEKRADFDHILTFLGLFFSAFSIISFFIFPLGTSRVGYLPYVFSIFVLSQKNIILATDGKIHTIQVWNYITLLLFGFLIFTGFLVYNPYEV